MRISAVLVYVPLVAMASGLTAASPDSPAQSYRNQYLGIDTVAVSASADIVVTRPDGTRSEGRGTIEYTGAGRAYRVTVVVDRRLGLLTDMTVAFDGVTQYRYFHDDDLLTLTTTPQSAQLALPNPVYLPLVAFAAVSEEAPLAGHASWDAELERWLESNDAGDQVVLESGAANLEVETARSIGVVRTRFARVGSRWVVSSVEYGSRAGDVEHQSLRFSDHVATGSNDEVLLPRRIEYEGYKGGAHLKLSMLVHTMRVNESVDQGLFRMDPEHVTRVMDLDQNRFLKSTHVTCEPR